MSSESGLSDAAPPSDAILEKTLRDIVRKAEVDPITVKRVRTAAEERLGLDAGFFKSHDEWNEESKEIIEDAFKSPSPEPIPPKKAPSQAKTTKRTSTSKTKSAPKRQKRAVSGSESEHSDFESGEEPKPKSKPAQRKSQAVDSDEEEEQEDNQDAEVQQEEVAANHDSESEMSVVLDEAPPKRKKSTSAGPKTKAQPKAKSAKAAAKPSAELSEEEQTIKRLQGELLKCGVRKLWHRELASYDTPRAKIGHLKQMLKDVGMVGRFSEQKAKAIKERRELEADLEAVQEGAKQWGNEKDSGEDDSEAEAAPRPQRRAAANRFVDFGDGDDDDDDE
ncbi:hypothetical protein E4T50_01159 [Aureobasidium sp. EXF-12298]|nr:hypothetical protein E4T50_01159 [Aureobasidium sp. EXF-12298]KAI4766222.1 hypothetical protein E4T51_00816 [Aureobasidium sp. EXF-12344]KAI4783741.1 hypothetical protein E4T52_01350 [Aureobasidium sp. EXF-3400]